MSSIAQRANATRRELRRLKEQSGPDDIAVQRMRAVAMRWIAKLQTEQRLSGLARKSNVA
jgi:hypothetical protein